ncbi:hypothetical protein B0H14DRAFT_2451649 [Mycena olivaceomarginata]|nr:hypothetical protein B0H14DRAFT_2451649 [Mycena olivaceomarginata]
MTASTELIHSPDFWFSDGTVIIRAQNTLYRVYGGFLASRSKVFHDTFSVPQPLATQEGIDTIGGCHVLYLHDKAKDFTFFLRVLHSGPSYKTCPVSNFVELKSILRLSDKYDVPTLQRSMITILSDLYPNTLDKWAGREAPPGYSAEEHDHLSVLNLAVEMDIRPILPVIMYDVCTHYDLAHLVGAAIKNAEYRRRCILGYSRLQLAQRRALSYLKPVDGQEECDTDVDCNAERFRWMGFELDGDHFDPLTDDNLDSWKHLALCATCLEAAQKKYRDARQKLWDELPTVFELGSWDKLLAVA